VYFWSEDGAGSCRACYSQKSSAVQHR
jgi:hypothetical protein